LSVSTSQFAPAVDLDLALMKDIGIKEPVTFSFGAQAYNALNHPNFDNPVADVSNPLFGTSVAEVAPPTSLLGAFVPGTAAFPRFVEQGRNPILRFIRRAYPPGGSCVAWAAAPRRKRPRAGGNNFAG
jgi:hypothetical protein